MRLMDRLKRLLRGPPKIPSGLYTYRGSGEFAGLALQLRVEPSGEGLLVINANTVLYLNRTAAAHAYFFMMGLSTEEAVRELRRLYRVGKEEARRDHEELIYTISTLAQTEEVCPISYLGVERAEPFSQVLSAPIRMDLALTFRCQNNCLHCYAGGPHETPELSTEDWKRVMDRLHELGVFIYTFTGGEPTLREDLPELLAHAQRIGAVTGLITNGRRLKDEEYVESLVEAGLDFVQITLESHLPEVHDAITQSPGSWEETVEGIRRIVPTPIYATTNTTLNRMNADHFLETIQFIHDLGVRAFGCNSLIYSGKAPEVAEEFALPIEGLKELLPKVLVKARALEMKFNWFTPTPYCVLNPVSLGLGVKSCSACRANMCIGPQGEVYPCQSYFEPLGNILRDDWDSIWNHPLCQEIRNRDYAPEKCRECPEFQICGAGCPLELKEKGYLCPGPP
ncbi:radical SAM protein [Candidatus Bathyarchaeota archaeon]|nr:radical SAM protein [Candidatus Bathyarchaeota archaeon]